MKKLTIIVTCTDRKASLAEGQHRIGALAPAGLHDRFEDWTDRLGSAADRQPLRELYRGDNWHQVLRLQQATERAGFSPETYVVSAGLGLQSVDSLWPSYSATFASRHVDSVAQNGISNSDWWRALNGMPGSADASKFAPNVLVVMSNAYGAAFHDDLTHIALRSKNVLLFGGHSDIEGINRVAPNGKLRTALGGTLSALNLRSAVRWIELLDAPILWSPKRAAEWGRWSTRIAVDEVYQRERLEDESVMALIVGLRSEDPNVSRSRALRILRDGGYACEQARFAELFTRAIDEAEARAGSRRLGCAS